MMMGGKNLPKEVGVDDLTYVWNDCGIYTAWITEFPAIVHEGDTKEDALSNINKLLTHLSILRKINLIN